MATFFEMIKRVLDREYAQLGGAGKDDAIKKRLEELSEHYSDVLGKGGPSYADEITRFAYVFRYTTAHAEYLNQAFSWASDLCNAVERSDVSVTCIGGGPGSDVLGFVKFLLAKEGDKPQLTFSILDKEQLWADTWAGLDPIVSEEIKTSRTFLNIDVTQPNSYAGHKKPFQANVFTLLYFLSEIFSLKDAATTFLDHCFSAMEKGALLVVLDFKDSRLQEWIDGLAKNAGLDCIKSGEFRTVVGPDEEKSAMEEYIEKFGYPKLQAEIMFRLYRK